MRNVVRAVCASLVFAYPPLLAAEWTQFRGPTGDGISASDNVPSTWSATEHIKWKQAIPGVGWSSPVVQNDRIYLTTAIGGGEEPISLRAICVDANDGKIIWNVEVLQPDAESAEKVHRKNSMASPTPLIHEGRLYLHFGHLGSAALDLDGNVLWRETSLKYSPTHGNGGSPVIADGALIFSCDASKEPFLAALEISSGEIRWKVPRNTNAKKTFSFSTPMIIAVDGVQQVVSAGSGIVAAYSPRDGQELWRVAYGEGYSVVPRPVFANGLIFVSSGYNKPQLIAIDPKGASGDVTASNIVWTHNRGAPLTPSMLVVGKELYFVSDNGVATCLDARTHENHWTKRLGGDFSASPVYAEGKIYFTNEAGITRVVKSGVEFESLAQNDLGERSLASPAVIDGAIFMRTESHLFRIGD